MQGLIMDISVEVVLILDFRVEDRSNLIMISNYIKLTVANGFQHSFQTGYEVVYFCKAWLITRLAH